MKLQVIDISESSPKLIGDMTFLNRPHKGEYIMLCGSVIFEVDSVVHKVGFGDGTMTVRVRRIEQQVREAPKQIQEYKALPAPDAMIDEDYYAV